jgi:hypothetical protein
MRTSLRRLAPRARALATEAGQRGGFSTRTIAAGSALAGFGLAYAMRRATTSYDMNNQRGGADETLASLSTEAQAPRVVQVLYHDEAGTPQYARLDEQIFTAEQQRQTLALERSRAPLTSAALSALNASLDGAFAATQGAERVRAFASWYFAYSTTYELMRVAVVAATMAVPTGTPAREAASDAVASAVLDKYSALVLRPAVSEPALRHAFERAATSARAEVLDTLGRLHAEAVPLLRKHTTHLEGAQTRAGRAQTGGARLQIDWRFARGTGAGLETAHGRPSELATPALLGAGALAGKVAAGAGGKAVAGAAAKGIASKLAAPFVAKATSAAAAGAAGGAAASAAGPVGAAVGAGVGLAVDWALAKGVELVGRAELERDVRRRSGGLAEVYCIPMRALHQHFVLVLTCQVAAALQTAQAEWRCAMEAELGRAVGAVLDDAIQLTAARPSPSVGEPPADEHTPQGGGPPMTAAAVATADSSCLATSEQLRS